MSLQKHVGNILRWDCLAVVMACSLLFVGCVTTARTDGALEPRDSDQQHVAFAWEMLPMAIERTCESPFTWSMLSLEGSILWDLTTESPEQLADAALRTLNSDVVNVEEKAHAARALGILRVESACPLLRQLLESPLPLLRLVAIRSLADLGNRCSSKALMPLLSDTARWEDALLIWHVDPEETLHDYFADPKETLSDGLSLFTLAPPRSQVTTAYGVNDRSALAAVAWLDTRSSLPHVLDYLSRADAWDKRTAIVMLGGIASPTSLPLLRGYLTDEDAMTCEYARVAIIRVKSRTKPLEDLYRDLRSDDEVVRACAIRRLAESGGSKAIEQLEKSFNDMRPAGFAWRTQILWGGTTADFARIAVKQIRLRLARDGNTACSVQE